MDLESVADELYGLAWGEFVAVRTERAAEAKAAGDKDLAASIRALRKPTRAAWLVNQFARSQPERLGKLRELGDALRQAHAELSGDDLRALSRQRLELVRALTDQVRQLPDAAVSDAIAQEVAQTLEAALGDPESARAVLAGRLTTSLQPGDVFSGDWLPAQPATGLDLRRKTEERAGQRRQAEEAARQKREQLDTARDAAKQARHARDEARKRLRAAEKEEVKARERTETARAALVEAEREVAQAESVVADLQN